VADLVGLPDGHDRAVQLRARLFQLDRSEIGPIELPQQVGDPGVLVEERAPRDLGRVGREDQLHPHAGDGLMELVRGDPTSNQPREHLLA
jgi:hypothetical protein